MTLWTVAHQATLYMEFSRQKYWSGLPFPSPMHESESEGTQSCLTLSDPMDCSLTGSSVHGIFQARVLEWVNRHDSVCVRTGERECCLLREGRAQAFQMEREFTHYLIHSHLLSDQQIQTDLESVQSNKNFNSFFHRN